MFYSIVESLISKTFSSKVDEATELDFEWFLVFFERFLVTICGKQVAEGTNIYAELYWGATFFILFLNQDD